MPHRDPLYRRHRFPAEIIAHAVWLYFRFPLSLRMVEDLLAARGIIVSHQTIRQWAEKFGRTFSNEIRRRSSGRLGDKWHLDEAVVSIRGKKHWLWRAVDQDGFVLEVLVQSRRNAKAAKRLMRKLLKSQGRAPRVLITDKLRSYDAAKRENMPGVEHRSHKGLNNRAENSHQPVRRRERIMKRFKSRRHLQRFISIHDTIANLFHIPRHDIPSSHHRELRAAAMNLWVKIARSRPTNSAGVMAALVAVKFTMPPEHVDQDLGGFDYISADCQAWMRDAASSRCWGRTRE